MNRAMFAVAALYRFTPLPDCAALVAPLTAVARANGIKGTLLLAPEGINGTLAGPPDGVAAMLLALRELPGCAALEVKHSAAATMPFHRLKVRVKHEIVTMGQPDIDPLAAGTTVEPHDWNALIAAPGTIVIDTRNDYEVAIGSFAGAIDPQTPTFRDFPDWFRRHRNQLLAGDTPPVVAMFCTGGIRCEKATAFLKAEGIADVRHLHGGILRYLETVAPEDSLWQGECFVFDERVSVGHGLQPGSHALCRGCRRPVSAADRASPLYVEGISCPACHTSRSDAQRAGYAERHRQEQLAATRGTAHVGAVLPVDD
ncbi:MAG: rhodanese-related sulfurtransferase [Polymorphobacter sp.]